jgi:hypothetical protein
LTFDKEEKDDREQSLGLGGEGTLLFPCCHPWWLRTHLDRQKAKSASASRGTHLSFSLGM